MKKKHNIKMLRRAISLIVVFAMIFTSLPPISIDIPKIGIHWDFNNTLIAKAEGETPAMAEDHFENASSGAYSVSFENGIRKVTINTAAQFLEYSIAYHEFPSHNHDTDVITLSFTDNSICDLVGVTYSEGNNNLGGFRSIGSDSLPFKGKIKKTDADAIVNLNLDKPFFGTLEQCAEVCILSLSRRTESAQTSFTPMLAQKIQNTTGATAALNLSVVLSADTLNGNNVISDYAGVIGTLDEDSSVNLTVKNNTKYAKGTANVKAAGAVGFLCCSMGEKSSLTATINIDTNSNIKNVNYTVTSTGASAGGLVGTMANGAKLILSNNQLNNITQSITGSTYAGGIVGDATGAYIGVSDPGRTIGSMTITSNFKASSTTLSATTASGYLFGRYINEATSYPEIPADGETPAVPASTVNDRTFVIDSSFRNVSLTFNSNNAGGYYGVLDNNNSGATITFNGGISDITANLNDSSDTMLKVNYNSKSDVGGVIYKYKANALENSLIVENTYIYVNGNVTNFGGVCSVADDSGSAAYISIHDFYTRQAKTATSSGGLICNSNSCFIDVSGTIRIKGNVQGGLIYSMPKGVLRLAGVTKLGEISESEGLIVKNRTNGLIYSKGDGKTESTWKLIRMNNSDKSKESVDDVGSWGEVVRLTESGDIKSLATDTNEDYVIDESALETDHFITIPTFDATAISGRDDLIRLALHIQLKVGDSPTTTSATGSAMVMAGAGSKSILSNSITISSSSSDISLIGTGITGLTRDNGDNNKYTGTFNGNNKTITLAIGEAYGYKSNGTDLAVNTNGNDGSTGRIYRHAYNGLFAKLGNGATIQNLTVDGIIYLGNNMTPDHYTGGFGASIEAGTIEFSNATSSIEMYLYGKQKSAYSGGFVSRIADSNVTLNFYDCTSDVTFYDNKNEGTNTDNEIFFGGFVSMITWQSQNVNVNIKKSATGTGCKLSGAYSNVDYSNPPYTAKYGGLIAYIENKNDNGYKGYWNTRKINIESLDIDGLTIDAKIGKTGANYGCAALLGYEWYGADVTIQDLNIGKTSECRISINSGSVDGVKMSGLCTIATGHWQVESIEIERLKVEGKKSSFGMIINSAFRPKNDDGVPAMYLELTNMKDYIISSDASKVGFTGITNGFDEIVLHSWMARGGSRDDIGDNGASIISINTDANANSPSLIMSGSACNTYQNQTSFGKTVAHNPNARYYYNLNYLRSKIAAGTATTAERFLLWSVYQYAYNLSTIRSYFNNTNTNGTLSYSDLQGGDLDMVGLSYYPIDYADGRTLVNNTTIKFYNEQIELGESAGTGVTSSDGTGGIVNDDRNRTTSGTNSSHTQHYMMHCGLFRDFVKGGKTFNTKNLTLKGSVGIYNGGSGFLIGGNLGGANSTVNFKPDGNNGGSKTYTINLDGAYVYNPNSVDYAPLLINSVGKNTTIHLYGVKTMDTNNVYSSKQATASWYAASSLIGKVGASDGSSTGINLDFSKIVLDSRKVNGNLSTDTELTTAYSTSRSIFKRATLLHWFIYNDSNSGGTYNYTYDEDWPASGNKHQVTYGQEVKFTFDNNDDYPDYDASNQKHYLGDAVHFTDPTTGLNVSGVYDFAIDKFLPYVGDYAKTLQNGQTLSSDTHDSKYHELDVNLMVASLINGCGTYNDPYVISEAGQFLALAKILKGDTIDEKFRINLPNSDKNHLTSTDGDRNLYWCTSDTDHIAFYPDNGIYKRATDIANNPSTSNTYTTDQVRMYLAGAYYQITSDFTLSTKFPGLGVGDSNNSGAYSFHGVIVGKEGTYSKLDGTEGTETRYPHIKNKSGSSLIVASNGSVIKNVGIDVLDVNKVIEEASPNTATFEYNAGCDSYGAVISKIMGGDNVIDNVPVTFVDAIFTLEDGAQVVPVGGYVGVVVNGGLFFRNMTGNISGLAASDSSTTLASGVTFNIGNTAQTGILSSTKYLYINPIIGRVINGYAVTESSTYKPAEANVTMKNTAKNYSIADILTTDQVTIGTNAITANTAQDFFILSLIVNSGTGSTASALSYDKATFKVTHIGTYEDVGCKQNKTTTADQSNTVCDYALFASGYSELTDASATPYITVKYTSSPANALVLTDSGKSYSISMSGSPWTMPDGYRGIGGFNAANSSLQLGVSGLNSNSENTISITLNSNYCTYEQTYDNYFTAENCGFGLFNTFVPAANCTVEKLTLNGQVKVVAYDSSNGAEHVITGDRNRYLSAGMLAGVKSNANAFNLKTLTLSPSGDGVYSFQDAGGLIGNLSGAGAVTVTDCTGTALIIRSAGHSGGFFGKSGSPIRINESSGTTTISIKSIINVDGTNSWTANSAGGIIGYDVDSIIKNVTVSQSAGGTGITLSSAKGGSGGLIGISAPNVNTNVIEDCAVNDLNVTGRRTAAVVGQYEPGSVKTVTIKNVIVNGKTGSGSKTTVERSSDGNIGTIVGYVTSSSITIENCNSKNYIIKSNEGSTGGCVGFVGANGKVILKNYLIEACEFQSASKETGGIIGGLKGNGSQVLGYNIAMNSITKTNKYAADFVGSYENKTLKIVGFSRKDTPIPSTASDRIAICSNAVCVSDTTQTELPAGSYIIFTDYNGKGYDSSGTPNTTNHSKIKQMTTTGTGEGATTEYSELITAFTDALKSPYVLINPYEEIDANTILTGDGIAGSVVNLTINDILSGITNGDSIAYTYPGITFDTAHLSTMNAEFGSSTLTDDFAVLVLEDTDHWNSQELINGYLQLLTSTKFNYADGTTNSSVFATQLYKMVLQEEQQGNVTVKKFVKTGDANLKIDTSNRFYMTNNNDSVDTGGTDVMFSLIDIQFYDPTVASNPEVVYHLYVPVLVKKMLKYSFNIATGSGTIYDTEWYGDPSSSSSRYGKILLENLGTPGTLYFTYSYERTLKEWQDALDSGENLLLNYNKVLNMSKTNAALNDMASDTILTLVDTNRNDKCYYTRFSGAWSGGELCLYDASQDTATSFKTSLGSSGTAFAPVSMCELMNIGVTENLSSGKFISLGNSATGATVKVGSTYYRLYDEATDTGANAPSMRYDLTVINKKGVNTAPVNDQTAVILTESYYLSFFTKASSTPNDNTINYYEITAPVQLTGGAAVAKAVARQGAFVLFGNLYQQSDMILTANPYPNDPDKKNDKLITESNNFVRAKLQTTVSLTPVALAYGIDTKLDESVEIYQSFVVYLTKHKDDLDIKGIVGSPTVTASYKITPVNVSQTYQEITPTGSQKNELNYVEATTGQSIKEFLKNAGGAIITAEIDMIYGSSDQRSAQFPVDKTTTGQPANYTFITASSNVAYDSNKTAYSKNQVSLGNDTNNMKYYITTGNEATLTYNAVADGNGNPYGQLGINANDLEDNTGKVKIKTNAVYSLEDLASEVPIADYPYVKVTFKLSQKQPQTTGYGSALPIGQYMTNVMVKGTGITTATPKKYSGGQYIDIDNSDTEYSFILNRSELKTNNDVNVLSIPIEFEVYTGTGKFETDQLMYGNFKIDITAQCLTSNSAQSGSGLARNYIVYTNAKLITEYIN